MTGSSTLNAFQKLVSHFSLNEVPEELVLNKRKRYVDFFENDPTLSLINGVENAIEYFFDKGMLREAIQDFNKAINLDNGQIDAYVYRTLILIRNNRFEEALFSLSRAEKIDPSNYLIYLNRGIIYQKKGDYKTAIKSIDKGLLFKPKDSSLLSRRESLERILKTDF